jgi:hypothetical protein
LLPSFWGVCFILLQPIKPKAMKPVAELKEERQEKNSQLFNKVGLFWAFSDKQFEESKTPLKEGDKYVSIGMGGFLPKSNVEAFKSGLEEIQKWYNEEIKKNKAEKAEILYELYNHECFYTRDISDVVSMFAGIYTEEQIIKVFVKESKKAA